MKKLIFGIVLLLCVNSYAINGFSIYKMYTQYDTVTHLNLDSNLNRPASWSSLLVDTLDRKFIRFSDLTSGDTTLSSIKVDTIRSNPYIDSTKGNTVHTGNYTTTGSMTVDTLKSTKGINATGGTFSGRVTATDLQVSDSIKAVYGDFSGVLEVDSLKSLKGINATGGTFSGALTSTTLNTGNGANELYPMDQDQRTTASPTHVLGTYTEGVRAYNSTSAGTFIGIFKNQGSLPGYPSSSFPVLKTDYSDLYISVADKYSAAFTGKDCQLLLKDSTITTKISLNTRGLSYFRGGKVNFDSLSFSSGSTLKRYSDTTFSVRLFEGSSYKVTGTCKAMAIGNQVTLLINGLSTTLAGGNAVIVHDIPINMVPTSPTILPIYLRCGGGEQIGQATLNNGFIYLYTATGGYLPSGSGGLEYCTLTYIK